MPRSLNGQELKKPRESEGVEDFGNWDLSRKISSTSSSQESKYFKAAELEQLV